MGFLKSLCELLLEKELGRGEERRGIGNRKRGRIKILLVPKSWVTTEKKAEILVTPFLKCSRVLIGCKRERVRCKWNSDNGEGEMSGKG